MEMFLDRSFGNIPAAWLLTESLIADKHKVHTPGIESLQNDITLFILWELGHKYIHLIQTLGKQRLRLNILTPVELRLPWDLLKGKHIDMFDLILKYTCTQKG